MKIQNIVKSVSSKFVSGFLTLVLIFVTAFGPQIALALSLTSSKDTATRLKISTLADHTIVFTLPTGIDFDSTTQTDAIRIDFPSTFATAGTWTAGEFTLNDGTARTSVTPSQGSGIIDCTVAAGTNNFCVAIDTVAFIFTIKPSATWTASATAATVTFTIAGSATNGTLTNPASVAATNIDFQVCDEVASCLTAFTNSHSSSIAYAIADDDQVTVTAVVGSSITFDIDTNTNPATETNAPYSVALGTITTADTRISGTTDSVNVIILEGDTSGAGGMVVTVRNANGANGLVSTGTPANNINNSAGTMTTGTTERYGLCVDTASLAGFARAATYNAGVCAINTIGNEVKGLTTAGDSIISTTAPFTGGHAEVIVNAEITTATSAHNDYTDTLTFIATGTF